MKNLLWFAAVAVSVVSLPLMAQQVGASGQQNTSVSAGQVHASDSSSANASGSTGHSGAGASGAVEMRSVHGELQNRLDTKTAKAGDQVVVKTTERFKAADGTEIPKGTRLIGHVTQAQAHAKGQAQSQLAIAFDRAELKGGESFAIHSVIESVAPPASAMAMAGADDSSDAMMGSSAAVAGGGRAGGGLVNGSRGMVGGAVDGVGDTAGRVGSGVDAAADGSMNATGRAATGATGMADGTARGAMGASASMAAHATVIPGVMLSGEASGSASGMLTATGKNVELDSGAQMVLGVAKQ